MRRGPQGDEVVSIPVPEVSGQSYVPYLPPLAVEWSAESPQQSWRELEGTIVFADVSGFTHLSERLSRRGREGAEEVTEVIGGCFARLLGLARDDGGNLLKFGGDALLLLFTDADHARRGCRVAWRMRRAMRETGILNTSVGQVRLRISIGVHSGRIHFFWVGGSHRELIVTGPAATTAVAMEKLAEAGEIVVSQSTAECLGARLLGPPKGAGWLLRDVSVDLGAVDDPPSGHVRADLSQAVPLALRAHLAGGGVEPEHRTASIAFLKYEQVDGLLARAGPQAVAEALDELVVTTQAAADAEEVTFLTSDIDGDGGKLILVTGVPYALGDEEGRLLRAVRRIADAHKLLPVRIGVNRGHVFAGEIGPAYRRTYTVMGDAVNVAARLMAAAAAGQVLSTGAVVERSRTQFHVEGPQALHLKGKTAPVEAFAVGSATGWRSAHSGRVGRTLPLVGRDDELAALSEVIEAAWAGRGTLVEIVGGAGVGKSRLVDEVQARTNMAAVKVVCEAYQQSTPYYPFGQMLRELLELPIDLNNEGGRLQVEHRVAAVAPELRGWVPLLGVLLDLEVADTPETAALEPRFRRDRTRQVTTELLSVLLCRPTLLVFEDGQWLDEASADLLGHLTRTVASRPWVVCVTRRDQEGGFRAPAGSQSRCLDLSPLPPEAAAELVDFATDASPLRPHEVEALVQRAGGNPLFLEELLRAGPADGSLPESLESVVSVQIDRLPARSRRLLRFAAVLGTGFARSLLTAVASEELERSPLAELHQLEEFVEPDGAERLRFRNRLIRDVAYQGLSFRRRRELHSRAGDAIERTGGEGAGDQAEVLSLHFLAAQRWEEAWRYAVLAADRAQAKYANVDAAELYERALVAARHLPDLDASEVARVWEALGDVRHLAGMYESAAGAYTAARRLLSDPAALGRLFLKQARVAERQHRYSHGLRWAKRGLRFLEGTNSTEVASQRAQLSAWYATVRQRQGRHREAIKWAKRAIDEATAGGDRTALAQAYRVLDWAYVDLGRLDLASNSAAALRIYEEMGDLSGQAEVLNNLGGFAYYQGQWDEALEFYARSRGAKLATGNVVDAASATANIAEVLADQGHLEEAEAGFREALRVWRASGYGRWVGFAKMHLGRIAARRGRFEEAMLLLSEARDGFVAIDGAAEALETDVWMAECLLLQGDHDAALALTENALAREAAMGGAGVQRATLHRIRGYAFAGRGQVLEAWAALDDSLSAARSRHATYETALTLEALSVIAPLAGMPYDPSEDEGRLVLERLGVRHLPPVPLPNPGASEVGIG